MGRPKGLTVGGPPVLVDRALERRPGATGCSPKLPAAREGRGRRCTTRRIQCPAVEDAPALAGMIGTINELCLNSGSSCEIENFPLAGCLVSRLERVRGMPTATIVIGRRARDESRGSAWRTKSQLTPDFYETYAGLKLEGLN